MGVLRDLAFGALGYGAKSTQLKMKASKNEIIDNLMQNNNLRHVLDVYKDSNGIRTNSNKFEKFIDELQDVVDSYKRELQ